MDEDAWNKAKPSSDFFEYFPSDSITAQQQSEIKMLFDSKYLYVGIKVNALDNDFIIPSLRRDFSAGGNDSMTLIFDNHLTMELMHLFLVQTQQVFKGKCC